MKGYKAFNLDLTCRGFQYEIGKTYTHEGEIEPCRSGFHFCKTIADCYRFYPTNENTRICEVEALGGVKTDDKIKYVTNKIKIIAEITEEWSRKGNSDSSSVGYCNAGKHNTGRNNTGIRNTGENNSGSFNTGNCNTGNWNSGSNNTGISNSGYCNTGDDNSGNHNRGHHNSGNHNCGNRNAGNWNSGSRNTGNWNSGHGNTGDWNFGSYNNGCFCTEKGPTIKFFDKDSDWTLDKWFRSRARDLLENCPQNHLEFIHSEDMTDKEKERHPNYEVVNGFLKEVEATAEDKQKWWNSLKKENKEVIMSLPNFDADKFKLCTGIEVR